MKRLLPCRRTAPGFALSELMIVVVILGIISSVSTVNFIFALRNAQVNEVALQLAGWLEQISRRPEANGTACTVTFNTGPVNSGAIMATVEPPNCSPEPSFRVVSLIGNDPLSIGSSATTVTFTPRTAITSTTDVQVRISRGNRPPLRCIRLSAVLGLIRQGRDGSTASTSANCPAASFDTI
jgi:prepilin-type N-terminal cleavage/methylation domain-containing protein